MRRRGNGLVIGRGELAKGFAEVAGVGRGLVDRGISHAFIVCGMLTGLDRVGSGIVVPYVLHGGGKSKEDIGMDGMVHTMFTFSREEYGIWRTKGAYAGEVGINLHYDFVGANCLIAAQEP